jgi:hypothetical protein
VAQDHGEPVAADAVLRSGRVIIYFVGYSSEQGKRSGASTMLFDHIIHEHSGQPLTLDFEGSMIPGIAAFFKSLGGVEVPYWQVVMNRLPWPLKLLKR